MFMGYNEGNVVYHAFGRFTYGSDCYESVEDATNRLGGGLIICSRLEEDNGGRLRLYKIYAQNHIEIKSTWHDMFTYTRDAVDLKKGFYLCRIKEFRRDKNDYVNMVVETITYLGESITAIPEAVNWQLARKLMLMDDEEDKPAWQFLRREMSHIAFAWNATYYGDYDEENAVEMGYTSEDVIARVISGDVAVLDELSKWLTAPTKFEKAKELIRDSLEDEEFKNKYPLLVKKMEKKERNEIIPFLQKHLKDFEEKVLEAQIPEGALPAEIILVKVEKALMYWKEVHSAKKKPKKAKANKEEVK